MPSEIFRRHHKRFAMNKLFSLLLFSLLVACAPQAQTATSELSASEEEAQARFIRDQEELEREAQASADFAPPPDSPDEVHLLPNAASKEYSASDWVDDYPMRNQTQADKPMVKATAIIASDVNNYENADKPIASEPFTQQAVDTDETEQTELNYTATASAP